MSAVLLLGAGVGLGLVLVGRGLWPPPVGLSSSLRSLDRDGQAVRARTGSSRHTRSLLHRVGASFSGRLGERVARDLVVVGRSPEQFAVEKVTTSLALGGVMVGLALVLALAGEPVPTGLVLAMTVCAVTIGFATPDAILRSRAGARRAAFRQALSSYLDLVNVLLAGGAGIETSLQAAADAGDGWAFAQLRHALVRARTMRQSPWACLVELGEQVGVSELSEIAASVKLAGEQGARIKQSLTARAASLRAHQMARIEADAQAATERMGLPTVLMFLGFMVLLGYPAMQQIVLAL